MFPAVFIVTYLAGHAAISIGIPYVYVKVHLYLIDRQRANSKRADHKRKKGES